MGMLVHYLISIDKTQFAEIPVLKKPISGKTTDFK